MHMGDLASSSVHSPGCESLGETTLNISFLWVIRIPFTFNVEESIFT